MRHLFLILLALFAPALALAADPATMPTIDNSEALQQVLAAVQGFKGATAIGIAVLVTQIAMAVMKSAIAEKFLGHWQLLAVSGLSVASTVLGLKLAGVDWVGCLLSSVTVTAIQVFANQVITQIKQAPAATEALKVAQASKPGPSNVA